jgi:hypothetical protein
VLQGRFTGWPGRSQRPKLPFFGWEGFKAQGACEAHPQKSSDAAAVIGIDIGKNTFHLVGLDKRGAIELRIKVSRSQLERRLVDVPRCLVGLEAGQRFASHRPANPSSSPETKVKNVNNFAYLQSHYLTLTWR